MKLTADSIASSLDLNSKTANPPMTSLDSMNGPSIVVSFPRERRTRELIAVGASPPLWSIRPTLVASSAILPMASMNALGGGPEFSADFTSIMNRIAVSPFGVGYRVSSMSWGTTPAPLQFPREGRFGPPGFDNMDHF